ncbi:MAG: hypothetical protein AAF745_18900 [Planctomycetota bacterium]
MDRPFVTEHSRLEQTHGGFLARRELGRGVLVQRVRMLGQTNRRILIRHYAGRVFATCASLALDLAVYDTQCGAKLIRNGDWLTEILQRLFQSPWKLDLELLSRYLVACQRTARRPRLLEIPQQVWDDVPGSKRTLASAVDAFVPLGRLAVLHRRNMRAATRG